MRILPWRPAAVGLGLGLATAAMAMTAPLSASAARAGGPGPAGAAIAAARPAPAVPGRLVSFTVSCANLDTAAATLLGGSLGLPAQIPLNAAPLQGDFALSVTLPSSLRPGVYRPRVECSDGTSATVALRVESVRAAAAARAAAASERAAAATPTSPVSTGFAVGGLALMAIGAIAGGSALALLRRVRPLP